MQSMYVMYIYIYILYAGNVCVCMYICECACVCMYVCTSICVCIFVNFFFVSLSV